MVMQQKDRLFKAKAIGKKKVEVLYLQKRHFLKQLSSQDVKQYLEICASYTDIQKDGQDLIKEMKVKTKQKEAFLDGAKTHLAD